MYIVEKGKVSIVVSLIVGIRVLYIAYNLKPDPPDITIMMSVFVILLIPSIMMIFPNWFARNILAYIAIGWIDKYATDAKEPQNSSGAIKLLGWIALISILWLFESYY
jgi:hypothetical protein